MNLPVLILRTYRRIPGRLRGLWSFGTSTSHLALAAVQASSTPWRTLLSWSAPTIKADGWHASIGGWKLGEGDRGAQ